MPRVAKRLLALIVIAYLAPVHAQGVFHAPADSQAVEHPSPAGITPAGGSDSLRALLRPGKSPGTAMLLSAVLPGAGQFYNASYWKVPIVLGVGIYFISSWLDNNRRTQDFRQKYASSVAALALPLSVFQSDSLTFISHYYLQSREFYKEQRDTFTWYLVILYFVNIADAYVDASLSSFNVGPDLSLRLAPVAPGPQHSDPGLTIRLVF